MQSQRKEQTFIGKLMFEFVWSFRGSAFAGPLLLSSDHNAQKKTHSYHLSFFIFHQ